MISGSVGPGTGGGSAPFKDQNGRMEPPMTHETHTKSPRKAAPPADARSPEDKTQQHAQGAYTRLLIMAVLSFAAMYVLMYAMVDRPAHIHANINQAYMAAVMAAPMVMIELALMGAMYRSVRLNLGVLAGSVLVFVAAFAGIRQQAAVGNEEFLRSMIPHHSAAILMCREAQLTDAEIQSLCSNIVVSQQAEIEQMEALLARG